MCTDGANSSFPYLWGMCHPCMSDLLQPITLICSRELVASTHDVLLLLSRVEGRKAHSSLGLKRTLVLRATTKANWDLRIILRTGGAGTLRTIKYHDLLITSYSSPSSQMRTRRKQNQDSFSEIFNMTKITYKQW